MSRFLTISHVEGGPTLIRGPQRVPGDAPLVAEFRDGMDAMRFLTAVALSTNNPDARADYVERRAVRVIDYAIDGKWYVTDKPTSGDPAIAKFAERADADLFVNFMRIGA